MSPAVVTTKEIGWALIVVVLVAILSALASIGFTINYSHRQDARFCDVFNEFAAQAPRERSTGISDDEWERRQRGISEFNELRHRLGCT